jgi:REP element-mobilizing transposase RayT
MAAARSRGARKRHVQQELFRHGGKRKGAGRKPKHGRAGAAHKKRDPVKASHVLHVVMRTVSAVGNLRRREVYHALRAASRTTARRERFRIVHLSIQHNHVHLLAEADSEATLASGMQGFQISAARRINTALSANNRRRRGSVFTDRYHVVIMDSPKQVRHVLSYVLNNWRKHREDQHGVARTWLVDPFSTGILFAGWAELGGGPRWPIRAGYEPLVVSEPRSWLLRVGWKRHGLISVREVPSQRPSTAERR